MSTIRTSRDFVPVANAFVEIAPATLMGFFEYTFGVGPEPSIYIRPGQVTQQDYLNADGAEWLLYTRSVMSFRIEVQNGGAAIGGASLIVELGDRELAGAPLMRAWRPFHLASGNMIQTSLSNIELPGLVARFRIQTGTSTPAVGQLVAGSIIVRGL